MLDRPNVLLICTDHWPGKMIGRLGHHSVLTPTLDQCIANGVAFTNAYTETPMCVPARRSLMTGTHAKTHGDRFQGRMPMPDLPTLAQTFRDAGYQAYGVGKLHVRPSRDRIGFDDVMLNDDSGLTLETGLANDYGRFVTEHGYPGMDQAHGMLNSWEYRPWHLPERLHPTNWTAMEMGRYIARRDPTRPAFWFMSFLAPHPPLTPLEGYMNIYRDIDVPMPFVGDWAKDFDSLPLALKARPTYHWKRHDSEADTKRARRAFYALSTHVDHQIRAVIGTLREQGLDQNTIILFTSDHGDMLGDHRLWSKMLFYEGSAKIPMILVPTAELSERVGFNRLDDRLVVQADVMPTLLDLCDIPVPDSVEGLSMVGGRQRDYIYGEFYEDEYATRMVRDGRYKLVYYAVGNRVHLFDLQTDPDELQDLASDPDLAEIRGRMTQTLVENMYGSDNCWLDGDQLVGLPDQEWSPKYDYDLAHVGPSGYRFR